MNLISTSVFLSFRNLTLVMPMSSLNMPYGVCLVQRINFLLKYFMLKEVQDPQGNLQVSAGSLGFETLFGTHYYV